jgi:RNA-directed DNA polymerase
MQVIKTLPHLEGILRYKIDEIEEILSGKQKNHYHFQQFKGIVKGEKKFRHFNPSKKDLRHLQNKIHSRIFSTILLPPHVQGCVQGRGNITNAKIHKGKLYKFKTDLKAYFDFVSNKKVYDALHALGFSQKVSNILTRATTFEGHLAQGPPTSPFLANIAALPMDNELLSICREYNIFYSRYVDDLCFSSQTDFKELVPIIIAIIEKHDFFIGYKKTAYKKGPIELTGAKVGYNDLTPTQKQLLKFADPNTPDYTRKGLLIYFKGLSNN